MSKILAYGMILYHDQANKYSHLSGGEVLQELHDNIQSYMDCSKEPFLCHLVERVAKNEWRKVAWMRRKKLLKELSKL